MKRRAFIKKIISAFVMGGLLILAGCEKSGKPAGFGNQEKFWQLVNGEVKAEEPIGLAYAKETPAFYRDASMGKTDPSFVPRVEGG